MKKVITSILTYFLSLLVSVLLYNYLTMGKGYIWYNHLGASLWDYTWGWYNHTVPVALFNSFWVAILISLLDGLTERFLSSKVLSFILSLTVYAVGWVFIALYVSETYILSFGNTWTQDEIVKEIVFVVPFFTVFTIIIGYGLSYVLINFSSKWISSTKCLWLKKSN